MYTLSDERFSHRRRVGRGHGYSRCHGGTLAASFGIYDKLIDIINHLKSRIKQHWKFLLMLLLGLAVSILLCSRLMTYLLDNYPIPTNFLFIGVILGSLPLLFNKTVKPKGSPSLLLPFLLTLGIMILLFILNLNNSSDSKATATITVLTVPVFFQFIAYGAIASACMLIPGISGSFILVLLGAYGSFMAAIKDLNIPLLIPIGIGILLGLFLCAKLIGLLLKHFEQLTYAGILGFVMGSILPIYPLDFQLARDALICLPVMLVGAVITYFFNRMGGEA